MELRLTTVFIRYGFLPEVAAVHYKLGLGRQFSTRSDSEIESNNYEAQQPKIGFQHQQKNCNNYVTIITNSQKLSVIVSIYGLRQGFSRPPCNEVKPPAYL
jgi:hypothetical protein